MFRPKTVAALATVAATLTAAVPATGAGAATLKAKPRPAPTPAAAQTCQIIGLVNVLPSRLNNAVYANAQNQLSHLNGCGA